MRQEVTALRTHLTTAEQVCLEGGVWKKKRGLVKHITVWSSACFVAFRYI
jgi:hypothetical protein